MPTYDNRVGELGEMRKPPPTATLEEIREWNRALLTIYPDAEAELQLFSKTLKNGEMIIRRIKPVATWTRK